LPPYFVFRGYITPSSISVGALPQTPLKELTVLLQTQEKERKRNRKKFVATLLENNPCSYS